MPCGIKDSLVNKFDSRNNGERRNTLADHTWYSTSNDHNQRELTIVNVAQLVGKAPTKEKRIRVKVRMILTDNINMGSPDWLDRAARFVSETHDTVTPSIEFKGYDLHFSADNLFEHKGVKAPRCQMRSFEIHECGDSEQPDVAVTVHAVLSVLDGFVGMAGAIRRRRVLVQVYARCAFRNAANDS